MCVFNVILPIDKNILPLSPPLNYLPSPHHHNNIILCSHSYRFVFRVDITWSDDHKTTSFRSYSEFFDLQCELLSQFPQEAGEQKNSQRTLPFLPGKQIFRRSSRHLAEERLPKINNYITELLKLPEHISQCERVLRFFRSNWQEDRIRCDEGHGALSRENSTTSVKYTVKQLSNSRLPLNYSSSTEELLEGIEEHPSSSASSKRIFAING